MSGAMEFNHRLLWGVVLAARNGARLRAASQKTSSAEAIF